jgi:hypothetical protein
VVEFLPLEIGEVEKRHICVPLKVEEKHLETDWGGEEKFGQRDTSPRKSKRLHRTIRKPEPHDSMAQASSEVQLKDKVLKTRSISFHCWKLVWRDYIAYIEWMLRTLTGSVHFFRVQRMLLMMRWP